MGNAEMGNASPARPYRVAVHGLPYFCKKLTGLVDGNGWHVPYHSFLNPVGLAARLNEIAQCDLGYSWGGRVSMGTFLRAARAFGKTKIIMLWSGSDVLFARNQLKQQELHPWVARQIHWAVSPWLAEEVQALGVNCEYVQASFVQTVDPIPLPEKFSVLAYAPTLKKADLYGVDLMLQAANILPTMEFNLVGLEEGEVKGAPPNLKVHKHVDLSSFFKRATVLWRPVRHDGLSFMVLEALAHGRHVLYSHPLTGCLHTPTLEMACAELKRLRDLNDSGLLQVNDAGRQYIARACQPSIVRADLLRRWEQIILSPQPDFGRAGERATS